MSLVGLDSSGTYQRWRECYKEKGMMNALLGIKNKKFGTKKYFLYHICHHLQEVMKMCPVGHIPHSNSWLCWPRVWGRGQGMAGGRGSQQFPHQLVHIAHVPPPFGTSASYWQERLLLSSPGTMWKMKVARATGSGDWASTWVPF